MNLADLPAGSRVVIDANILIYRKISPQCAAFLRRCGTKEIDAAIPAVTLAEFCHRRMMIEAQATAALGSNPARKLAGRREVIGQLSIYAKEVSDLLQSGLEILALESADFPPALELQKNYGLLTNDSLLAAGALRRGFHAIATADSNFDNLQQVDIYKPTDV